MKESIDMISEKESTELEYKLQFFMLGLREIPEYLRGNYGYHARRPEWFDVNRYLEVFDKIQIMDGYTLDYFYNMGRSGGCPILFTRELGDKYYPTVDQMLKLMDTWSDKSSLIKHIGFERSPSGYFQFAVFNIVVHRFYLYWHSNYARSDFLFTKNQLKKKLKQIEEDKNTLHNKFISEDIIITPRVEILNDRDAKIILTMFSIWKGIFYHVTTIEYPNKILNTKKETIIPYDMGLRY
jgi:hypothetical protein